jgi:hypothetical protein
LKTEFTTNELIAFFTQPVENHSAGVIILMVCFYIGMGFIYQSAVFKEGGIAVVAVVYIIVAYASYIACKLLLKNLIFIIIQIWFDITMEMQVNGFLILV